MTEHLLGFRHAALGQRHGLVLLVDEIVAGAFELLAILSLDVALRDGAFFQSGDDSVHFVVEIGGLFGGSGNDQRRPGFVDQDAVDFVDDRVVVSPLHHGSEIELHVVAEIVEPELVIGPVGDVGAVRNLTLRVGQFVLDDADAHPEVSIDAPHPLGVAAGQIVVHGDDVHALAGESVEVGGQRRDERFALAGFHLGNLADVEDHAADQLHVEVPHVQHALAGFADDSECFDEQVIERFAVGDALPEFLRLVAELLLAEHLHLRLERANLDHAWSEPLELALVLRPYDLGEELTDHSLLWLVVGGRRFRMRGSPARTSNHQQTVPVCRRRRILRL